MGRACFVCDKNIGRFEQVNKRSDFDNAKVNLAPDGFDEEDVICVNCTENLMLAKAKEIIEYDKAHTTPEEFQKLRQTELYKKLLVEVERVNQTQISSDSVSSNLDISKSTINQQPLLQQSSSPSGTMQSSSFMTRNQMQKEITLMHDQYKSQWDKNGVIQFKNERIAILQRMWGQQVQFIVAYDQLTKEGYRLMIMDEGKEASTSGFAGGGKCVLLLPKNGLCKIVKLVINNN